MDAGEQLLVDERTRQAVVGARKRPHSRRGIGTAEHDDGAVGHDASVQRPGVPEQEHVWVRGERQLLRALAGDHVEAVVAQLALEKAANGRFRLGKKERGHDSEARRGTSAAPDVLCR